MNNVFHDGDPIIVAASNGTKVICTVSKAARDGRVQIWSDWFTPDVPDKYGRIARMLSDEEREEWELKKRMDVALRTLSRLSVTESLVEAVEQLVNANKE